MGIKKEGYLQKNLHKNMVCLKVKLNYYLLEQLKVENVVAMLKQVLRTKVK